jgi:hypothetical protein
MLHNTIATLFRCLIVDLLEPADDLEHDVVAAIDDLALLLLTHSHPHLLQQLP